MDVVRRYRAPIRKIVRDLGETILKPEYHAAKLGRPLRPYEGACYVASQALYHLLGGTEQSTWKPVRLRHEGSMHWWLRGPEGQIVDLTAEQFLTPVPYEQGVGGGFLTKQPDRRAQMVLDALPQR